MASPSLKIDHAAFVVTLDPQRRIIRDGSVLVQGQRIAAVGKALEMADMGADRVIDARDMVVTPGFVNAHIHLSYAHAVRGVYPDDLDASVYNAKIFELQAAMDEEEEYLTSLLAITELLKYGTTCMLDPGTTKHLDACMRAYEESGCRIVVGRTVLDQPTRNNLPVLSTAEAIAVTEETVARFDGRLDGRVRAWAMPFSPGVASPALLKAAKAIADRHHTGLTMHAASTPGTVKAHVEQYGGRPVERLEQLGVLGPNVALSWIVELSEGEMAAMVRTGAKAVVMPTSALKMGSGITTRGTLPEMLDMGICVALGTDAGNGSNLVETMRSMYLAAVLFKDARRSTSMVPTETALEMATLRGAEALGLADDVGSIEVGKKADLVLFDTRRPEWRGLFNPVNNLVYSADGRSVHTVLVDGRVVVEGHRAVFVDEAKLVGKVQRAGEALLARTATSYPSRWPVV